MASTLRLFFIFTALIFAIAGQRTPGHRRFHYPCPEGCVCLLTGSTVRCMHKRLTKIPRIQPETRILDLRFNHIRDIRPGAFDGLGKLHTLLMNNNHLRRVPADAFRGLSSLKHLYLYKNRIDQIHENAFNGLVSLEQLYLYTNDISSLEIGTLSNLPNLERLFLHNNVLTTLPEGLFDGLSSLRRLRLDNNRLMCDCKLLWFANMLLSLGGNIQATVTCHAPRYLFGRSISTIPLGEFKCTAPTIVTEPHSTQVRQGETIYMSCQASGSPQPEITWYRNGEVVPSDSRRRQSIGGSLIIMNPMRTDEGVYKCRASNAIGSVESREVQVVYRGTANGPPFFISRPQDVEVRAGEPTTLECRAAGTPEPVVTWVKDDQPLETQNRMFVLSSGSLHFRGTRTSDNGHYTCVAKSSEGEVNTTAELIVKSAPTFTQKPDDVMVLQGASAILNCRFTGNPTPSLTWLKNGRRLPRDQRYLVMTSGTLLIRVVNPEDEGRYTCRVQNSVSTVEAHAQLSVRVAPHFIVRPQNQRVREGRTIDFQCQASGIPQPHIVWTFNGRAIPDNGRYTILPSGTLRILRVTTSDAGIFRCEAANLLGARNAEVTLEVIPFRSIQFSRTPSDVTADSGTRIRIPCHVQTNGDDGLNSLSISWTKDSVGIVSSDERYSISSPPNSYLTILDVGQDDAGRYECIARSGPISARASMTLTVNVRSTTEEIISKLLDILPPGCLRRGCTHSTEVTPSPGELNRVTLNDLLRSDLGIEENLRQKRQASGLNELADTVNLVSRNIDGAINNTIHHFNDRRQRQSSSDLLALMRFPSTRRGVNMMRAAEIFEVSLHMIECCVRQGAKLRRFGLDDNKFDDEAILETQNSETTVAGRSSTSTTVEPVLKSHSQENGVPVIGTEVVAIVANLSGCSAHQKIPDCSANMCFHRKYRTADGTCNNLQHPMWGASLTPFHRLLKPIYENGFNAPVGWDSSKLYHEHTLPSPRRISIEVLMSRDPRPTTDADFTHMTMQWGQFIDHDLDFTTMAPSIKRFSDGVACKDSCDHEAPCFPIEVNPNDPRHRTFHHHATHNGHRASTLDGASTTCMEFTRSSAVCGSGITSVFFSALSRREQINQITSYHDASNVYGSTEEETKNLRDLSSNLGLLKEGQPLEPGQKPLLPYNVYSDLDSDSSQIRPVAPIECRRGDGETPQERSVPCFLCGDHRCNEQISLTSMHTLWMREHNRVARKLKEINRNWDGETIFQEARKIVGAEMQHITYSHWLPKILGPYYNRIGQYKMYNPNSPASIVNVFATAAFRFGHTMINPIMFRLNETWSENTPGNLMLHQAFFAPYRIIHEGGIDPLIRGLIAKPMKARDSDSNMNSELIEKLFELAEEVALDLGALNVQRGRDHALPFYNEWREFCNLTKAKTFDDLAGEITNQQVRQQLRSVYGSPDNIDPFVGMILEDITPGSRLGPTLGCLISEQFMRVRDNDRLWYENPGVFSPAQLTEIRQSSLAKIICDNTDSISTVPRDVFRNTHVSDFVSCSEIPSVDLRAWTECCDSCSGSEERGGETLSGHIRQNNRAKRDIEENIEAELDVGKTNMRKARKSRKVKKRKSTKLISPPVTINDKHKVFDELVWSQSLREASNPEELLDISRNIAGENEDEMEQTLKDIAKMEHFTSHSRFSKEKLNSGEDKNMDKIFDIINKLESRISSLQNEVQRLKTGKAEETTDLPN